MIEKKSKQGMPSGKTLAGIIDEQFHNIYLGISIHLT